MTNFLESSEQIKKEHRIHSASAMFQKGIYHLFTLRNSDSDTLDAFTHTLRLYQCIFLLSVAQILLDFEGEKFSSSQLSKKQREQANRDPGAAITHSWVENWSGFKANHPLYEISQETKRLFQDIVKARHNLIYRPYFELRDERWYWEDCTLEGLLRNVPAVDDVEQVYKDFYKFISKWMQGKNEDDIYVKWFKVSLITPLTNPPLTLLLNYARLLNPSLKLDFKLLKAVREYRTQLLGEEFEEKYLDSLLKETDHNQ